eukprot:1549130-Ditylum_brightwellii.AAC.1
MGKTGGKEEKKPKKGKSADNKYDWYEMSNEELDGDKEEQEYGEYNNEGGQTEVNENAKYIHKLAQQMDAVEQNL